MKIAGKSVRTPEKSNRQGWNEQDLLFSRFNGAMFCCSFRSLSCASIYLCKHCAHFWSHSLCLLSFFLLLFPYNSFDVCFSLLTFALILFSLTSAIYLIVLTSSILISELWWCFSFTLILGCTKPKEEHEINQLSHNCLKCIFWILLTEIRHRQTMFQHTKKKQRKQENRLNENLFFVRQQKWNPFLTQLLCKHNRVYRRRTNHLLPPNERVNTEIVCLYGEIHLWVEHLAKWRIMLHFYDDAQRGRESEWEIKKRNTVTFSCAVRFF